tara:strand:- start:306 stop:899 length:594 start_codon:yes stop_codon:yes gene_type:complete
MTEILRAPAGQPTGGQFAGHTRTEDSVSLLPTPARSYGNDQIVGYTYKAENYRAKDLVEQLITDGLAAPAARDMEIEDVLNQIAGTEAVDRDDEYSFDSDEFPKVVLGSQVDISDAPWLGDEHWTFADYENEPLTAEDALQQFIDTYEGAAEDLWDGTDHNASAEQNLAAIASQATYLGIDLDAEGYTLPKKVPARD